MKKIVIKNVRNLFLLVASLAMITSCKKESSTNACSGEPEITKISSTVDRTDVSSAGSLSDWIIIQGTNLCAAKTIMFNDVEVDLSNAYITQNEITVAIPRGIPTITNDLITVKTSGGEATFAYKVSVPDLIINGMYNEYTPAGATMVVTGKNFDLYEMNAENGKVVFGSTEVSIERSTPDSIFFKVPMDASVNTKVKLKDKRGVLANVPGQYKDNRGMIYDMTNNFWNGGKLTVQDGPVPAPISGKYAYWNGVYNDGKTWDWNEQFHIVAGAKLADVGVIGSSNNYLIKFEINCLDDWAKSAFKIKMLDITLEYPLYTNLPFKTKGWKTITIPMNKFKVNGEPVEVTQVLANASKEIRLMIHGGDRQALNVAFDNFRIVPID